MNSPLLSHIGIAVADMDAAIKTYTMLLGREADLVKDLPEMGIKVAIFSRGDSEGGQIELLAPTSKDNSIARFLDSHGNGLHHICILVDDIEAKLAEYKAAGVKLIDEKPRVGALGHKIAFVHPTSADGVLLELEEKG